MVTGYEWPHAPEAGLIRDYEKGKFVRATAEEVARRERYYKLYPEIAPPGTPGKITPAEYYERDIERTYASIKGIFPELVSEKAWPWTEAYEETFASVGKFAEEKPEEFVATLQEIGRTEETEQLLRTLFGLSEADIRGILEPVSIEENIERLYPGREVTLETLRMWAEEDAETFLEEVLSKGRTEDTEALLMALGASEADLEEIFGVELVGGAITEDGAFIEKGFFESLWGSFQFGTRQLLHRSKQFFVSTLPNMMFKDVKPGEPVVVGAKEGPVFTEEEAARINAFNKEMRDKNREIYVKNQTEHEDWLDTHKELQPPAYYREGPFEHPDLWTNPSYWAAVIGEAVPFTLGVMGTTVGVAFATKNPYIGLVAGAAVATPSQSQDLYEDLLASGAPEDKAADIAVPVGMVIASVEAITDLPLLGAVFAPFKKFGKAVFGELTKRTTLELIKRGVKTFSIIEIVEVMEEITQGAIHNAFVKAYDEDREIFENIDVTIVTTLIATSPFAVFGGGMSLRHVSPDIAGTVPDKQKKAEGWKQDRHTGEWYKPEKIVDVFNENLNKFKEEGLTEDQANLKAFNEAARTPEGAKAIGEAAKKIKTGIDELSALHEHPARIKGFKAATRAEVSDYLNRLKALTEQTTPQKVPLVNEAIREFNEGDLGTATIHAEDVLSTIHKFRIIGEPGYELKPVPEVKPPKITEAEEIALRIDEMEAELAGLKEWLSTEPAIKLINLIKKAGWYKGEVSNLTVASYRKLTGKTPSLTSLTKDKKHVKWEYALDDVATEMGYKSGEELKYAIEDAGKSLTRIKELESEIARTEVPEAKEIPPEKQLIRERVQKVREQYRRKIETYDAVKKTLYDIAKSAPAEVRGKMLAAMKNVKTEAQLDKALMRLGELAEQHDQRVLRTQIRKEIKRTQATVKQHILKGKFTPETQRLLDIVRHNLSMDRELARSQIETNFVKAQNGEIAWDEMLEANELLSFAGIDGMSSQELQNTLDYLRVLKTIGRSERRAKLDVWKEERNARNRDYTDLITGGKGVKPGGKALTVKEWGKISGAVESVLNANYGFSELVDKISKFERGVEPFKGKISQWVDGLVRRANNAEIAGIETQSGIAQEGVAEAYKTTNRGELNQILSRNETEKITLGTFKNADGVDVTLRYTKNEIIYFYNQMQDPTLEVTFRDYMKWTWQMEAAIINNLTTQEEVWADSIRQFYQDYYDSINEVFQKHYWIDLPHNLNYTPLSRDLESLTPENILLFRDTGFYASTLNNSLKSRTGSKADIKPMDANKVLVNHIIQMEHFKAWTGAMKELRSFFGNRDVRIAIEQYHGRNILKHFDNVLNDLARGGVDRAHVFHIADFLRRNFVLAVLSKPIIGVKQIFSQWAYMNEIPPSAAIKGFADFWTNPIKHYQLLMEHSPYIRDRFGAGYERDIKYAMRQRPAGMLSGTQSFKNWFMFHIRLGDKFAVMQGMWAVYKYNMRGKAETAENIEAAMIQAELATDRTQPTASLQSLSSLQRGGSWVKLMTMFQNQLNKYFRIIMGNARNIKYGRGSKARLTFGILMAWVILPALFQFVTDALQFKKEHQFRILLLGPLNQLLILGQFFQSAWGWLAKEPFEYQVSPVFDTFNDMRTAMMKVRKMIDAGIDPYVDVTADNVISFIEALAKAGGELLGYPTPYLVQVERALRAALEEKDPGKLKELIFSRWSLQPPMGDITRKVEEALEGLGQPRELTPEEERKRAEAEEKGIPFKAIEVKDMKDLYSDFRRIYHHILPDDIIKDKRSTPEAIAFAEALKSGAIADTLPDRPLYKINTDRDKEWTIVDFYKQWQARLRLDSLADLEEFDKLYPYAYLGNVTRQQYSLLVKYLETPDDKKKAFLEKHPELKLNPRDEWLKANPIDNAKLAIWGQAKLLTMDAYNEFNRLVKELDIPDDAIPELTLPPEGSVETHFEYLETGEEFGYSSVQVQLIKAKDHDYCEWADLDIPDTPIPALELRVQYDELFDKFKAYGDEDFAESHGLEYLESVPDKDDPDYEKGREYAREQLRLTKVDGEIEFRDIERQVEALEKGTETNPTPDAIIKGWVDRGREVDEFGGGSSEAMVWLVDNLETYRWALVNKLLKDDGGLPDDDPYFDTEERHSPAWNVPVLRINAEFRQNDLEYEELNTTEEREEYLTHHGEYKIARRKRDAYGIGLPEDLIQDYVTYYNMEKAGYDDERFLMEHPEFYAAMINPNIVGEENAWKGKDFSKVPTKKEEGLLEFYDKLATDVRLQARCESEELDKALVRLRGLEPAYGTERCEEKPRPFTKEGAEPKERKLTWYEQLEEQGLLDEWLKKFK